ncbi:hypothetical protein ACQCN2_14410 [Brevibacillus ginsengisoli]|uniref:hypothetical protein n=1 Tax=Brevibacillus ginsengisoli TaxID=363854 RepID=UPI003CF71982
MIQLNLSLIGNVRQSLQYNVSPLFEMAASLQAIAQSSRACQSHTSSLHYPWIEETLQRFKEEDLLAEWEYLSPIFAHDIPAFLTSHESYQANGIEQQYDYLVDLPNEVFVQAILDVFSQRTEEDPSLTPVEQDLADKPKVVKARFTLFLCTFMQSIFESKWEQLAPKLVLDIESKSSILLSHPDLVQLLRSWFPTIQYDVETECISIPRPKNSPDDTSLPITSLVLSPSWFIGEPSFKIIADKLCVTYGIAA